jgi:hypothetical protein
MTFIPVNFEEVVEPKAAAAGSYDLQITACKVTKTGEKSKRPGSPQYEVTIGFEGEPNVPNLRQYISLPHEEDEPNSANFKALLLKRFLVAFKVPFQANGFDIEGLAMEMVGATARLEVALDQPDANGNVYNRLVVPRIPGEAAGRGSPGRR